MMRIHSLFLAYVWIRASPKGYAGRGKRPISGDKVRQAKPDFSRNMKSDYHDN